MSRIQEWADPGKQSVLRPKHLRPATLQEKLERIQAEIERMGRDFIPKTATEKQLFEELLKREAVLIKEKSNG